MLINSTSRSDEKNNNGSLLYLFIRDNITHAQKNLQPGYITLNNNDTLRGFIDYREWYRNPVAISFGLSREAPTNSFTIKDMRYFEVNNRESYQRHVCQCRHQNKLRCSMVR